MKWYLNLKTSAKLISAFVLVAVIVAFVGIYGLNNMSRLNAGTKNMYENNLTPIGDLSSVQILYQSMRVNIRDMELIAKTPAEKDKYKSAIEGFKKDILAKIDTYGKAQLTQQEQDLLQKFAPEI